MKFYVAILSIYAIAVTILAGALMRQNLQLKKRPAVMRAFTDNGEFFDPDMRDIPMLGNPQAPVTIVEFNDFECPYCADGSKVVRNVMETNPGRIRLAFKPLTFTPRGKGAALAALAAYRQDRFWEMESLLFANQDRLGLQLYKEIAADLDLDVQAFEDAMNPAMWEDFLQLQQKEAERLKVMGTPTFFVNGLQIVGADPDVLGKAVEEALDQWEGTSHTSGK